MTKKYLVQTQEQADNLLRLLETADDIVFDIEATGLELHTDDNITGIAFYFPEEDKAFYYAYAHGTGIFEEEDLEFFEDSTYNLTRKKAALTDNVYDEHFKDEVVAGNYDNGDLLEEIKKRWARPNTNYYAHNAQFDMVGLEYAGFPRLKYCYDTMVLAHVLYTDWNRTFFHKVEEWGSKELKWLAYFFDIPEARLGEESLDKNIKEMSAKLQNIDKFCLDLDKKKHMWALHPEKVAPYAMTDVIITWKLHEILMDKIRKWDNEELYHNMCRMNMALFDVQMTGIKIDKKAGTKMYHLPQQEMDELNTRASELAGVEDFNLGSVQQIQEYCHAIGVNIPNVQKDTISEYAGRVEMLDLRLRYTDLQKLVGTYVEPWMENKKGIIHADINFTTKTGRTSSSYQQIPRDVKKEVSPKLLLVPHREDYFMVEGDYSNLELRLAAWVAETLVHQRDFTLTNLILNGEDMHAYTRDNTGIPEIILEGPITVDRMAQYLINNGVLRENLGSDSDIEKEFMKRARQAAKTVNFAIMYGSGARGISRAIGVNKKKAWQIINAWKNAYPAIKEAFKESEKLALKWRDVKGDKHCYIRYPYKGLDLVRKYDPYDVRAETKKGGVWNPRKYEARNAFNSVTQGTAALITLDALAGVYEADLGIDLHLTVHDSIIFSTPDLGVLPEIKRIMEDYDVYPPLVADFEVAPRGKSWGEKEEYRIEE